MSNQKRDLKNTFKQTNAPRGLAGPSEGNEACSVKMSFESSQSP